MGFGFVPKFAPHELDNFAAVIARMNDVELLMECIKRRKDFRLRYSLTGVFARWSNRRIDAKKARPLLLFCLEQIFLEDLIIQHSRGGTDL